MRKELVNHIRAQLEATGAFGMVAGIGCEKPRYPLARVWSNSTPAKNREDLPTAFIELAIAVQIETKLAVGVDGRTDDGPLYDLVDTVFSALHGHTPEDSKGLMPLIVHDAPGIGQYASDAPAVYVMQISAAVVPAAFSLT